MREKQRERESAEWRMAERLLMILEFSYSVHHSYTFFTQTVQITGSLKVKLPPVQHTGKNSMIETIQPSVEGFVGECRVIKSAASIIELALPHAMFTSTVTLNFKPISIDAM